MTGARSARTLRLTGEACNKKRTADEALRAENTQLKTENQNLKDELCTYEAELREFSKLATEAVLNTIPDEFDGGNGSRNGGRCAGWLRLPGSRWRRVV